MADEDLKEEVITYILLGILAFFLISFVLYVIANNNPNAISPSYIKELNDTKTSVRMSFINSSATADKVLNSTSYTNPEASYLGSKDQVATAYDTMGTGKSSWTNIKKLLGIVFSENPEIIIAFSAIVVFAFVMAIIAFLRIGK